MEHGTPLGLLSALTEISGRMVKAHASGTGVGVLCVTLQPDAALCRLSLEHGHKLEAEVAARLRRLLRKQDMLFSGERREWLVVLPGLPSSAVLTLAMMKIGQTFSEHPVALEGLEIEVPVVCGASMAPEHGENPLHLVQSARIAALVAAQANLGGQIYDPGMEQVSPRLAQLERELRACFAGDNRLELHLQPKVRPRVGNCDSAEGLLRWQRMPGDWVPAPVIISLIDRMGMRHLFNRWLFQRAAHTLHLLRKAGAEITLSINLSASDLYDAEVPDLIGQALATWGIEARHLCLEITETGMIEERNGEGVADVLRRLRAQGISLSIDDFGTGFSSMSRLQRLSVQEVKIDRSFIQDIVRSEKDREIAASIIELSHRLAISVTAEGVEDEPTAAILTALGCDHLQGYLFARAMPVGDFVAWLGLPRSGRTVAVPGATPDEDQVQHTTFR